VGNPETENATDELKLAKAAVVSFIVPLAAEVTITLAALGVREKPGTFRVSVCL
jgi:hypothetical protein